MKWLHISDIHLNFFYNNKETSNKLRKDLINYLKKEKFEIDYLFLTGDYRDSGYMRVVKQEEDFEDSSQNVSDYILEIARAANILAENIFLVPGNHDLTRDPSTVDMIKKIQREYGDIRSSFTEEELERLLNRFTYFDKLHSKVKNCPETESKTSHRLYEEKGLDILCVNSALTCYGEEQKGELLVDVHGISHTLENHKNKKKPLFILSHYDMEYFSTRVIEDLKITFDKRPTFYLCGHSHNLSHRYEDEFNLWTIMAGATKDEEGVGAVICIGELAPYGELSVLEYHKFTDHKWGMYNKFKKDLPIKDLMFVGEQQNPESFVGDEVISLPLTQSTTAKGEDREETIRIIKSLRYNLVNGMRQKYMISMIGVPVVVGILIGYALSESQNMVLYHKSRETSFLNEDEDKGIIFQEIMTKSIDSVKGKDEVNLLLYIHAKSRVDNNSLKNGKMSFEKYEETVDNSITTMFINEDIYNDSINLKISGLYLYNRMISIRESIKEQGVNKVNVHVFFNGFAGLAILFGNQIKSVFPIQLYDFDGDDEKYSPSYLLGTNIFK